MEDNAKMLSSNGQTHPNARPLWQLLLAAQTDQLLQLTTSETQALLELISDLVKEGFDEDALLVRLARYLPSDNRPHR
jgi:hypothetical protein